MSRLRLYLLGPPHIELDGEAVHLPRRKALALLAYLAVTGHPHRRDSLATLLWPENDQRSARAELSRTLSLLNRTLDAAFLDADRSTVVLDPEAEVWLDTTAFRDHLAACEAHHLDGCAGHPPTEVCDDCLPLLVEAVDLYRDDFLAGFTLRDAAQFDDWQAFESQALRDELAGALERLATLYGERGEHDQAIAHARRWLSLDPLHEPAHRALMDLYAQAGQRAAALRQYRQCVRVLEQELDAAPEEETAALYGQIRTARPQPRAEKAAAAAPASTPFPAFLDQELAAEPVRPLFVSREPELAQLNRYLDAALRGEGGMAFVTGDAGRGKTALLGEFARQAMTAHADLLVAMGNCNAYSGLGDPYLPFRELLAALTGDVSGRLAVNTVSREQARRLWQALPLAVEALLAHGGALIDQFLSGTALLSRAEATALGSAAPEDAPWLRRLRAQVEVGRTEANEPAQDGLLEQVTGVLRALAEAHPLLLCLDDLQWVDAASASLLFHLGRRLAGSRILILGAYRPEEVALGRGGERHPLEEVLSELKRAYGEVWVDLREADAREGQAFVEAFLDSEPNRLGESFRAALYAHTGGHPLFTVELLRAMQERGELVRDEAGCWGEGSALHWERLPARVEAVIEARVGRLPRDLRDLLVAASVEGELFTAQVVAQVQGVGDRELLRALSRELERRHQLVREQDIVSVDGQRLSRYRFAHALYQQHLYGDLGQGERALLHGEVAEALETLYEGHTDEVVAQLAHHYARAGNVAKAAEYLSRAGDRARLAYAHQEAIGHYEQAVSLFREREDHYRAARTLMKLGLTYHNAFRFAEARQAYEDGFALWQRAGRTMSMEALPPAPHALRVLGVDWGGVSTLDPAFQNDVNSAIAIVKLLSCLGALSPELNVEPDVAERWEVLDGGCRYVFHLRQDVRWSDGVPVTAGDFEYAWKRLLDPATRSSHAEECYLIRGARAYHQGEETNPDRVGVCAVDKRTLVVELEDPTGDLLHFVTSAHAVAVPRHAVQTHGAAWAEPDRLVTNGPFRLVAWEADGSLTFERSPTYHGRFTGNVAQVNVLARWASGLQMYEEDRLDVLELGQTPWLEQDRARQRHAGEYISQPMRTQDIIGLDVSKPPFDDRRIRQALTMATDREMLANVACGGLDFPATGSFSPPWTAGYSPGLALSYDPEKARRLLAEAGYPGGNGFLPVQALIADGPKRRGTIEVLQSQWFENLGIDVHWRVVELREFIKMLAPSAQKPSLWYTTIDWDSGRGDALWPVEGWFTVGWRNEAYERLREEIQHVVDPAERLRICHEAERIIAEEAPTIILLYPRWHLLVKPWVSRLPLAAVGGPWWKDVVIEPH